MQFKSTLGAWLGGALLGILFAIPVALAIVFGILYGQASSDLEQCRQPLTSAQSTWSTSPIPSGNSGPSTAAYTTEGPATNRTLRLPTSIVPIHYELLLQVFLPFDQTEESSPNTFRTVGTVEITLKPTEDDVDRITLHARTQAPSGSGKISFSQSQVQLRMGWSQLPVDRVEFQPESDVVVIFPRDRLYNGTEYILTIRDYEGVIASDTEGLYRSSFERNGRRNWLAVAKFQPHKARRMLPCFDEPSFRSSFSVTVKHKSRFTTVRSNGAGGIGRPIGDGWTETRFSTTPSMPVYLLTILVSTFGQRTLDYQSVRNSTISILGIEDMLLKHGNVTFSLRQSEKALEWMDDRFQQPYFSFMSKLDQAALPDFPAGATEDWGLVLYREANLLYEPGVTSADNKRAIAGVIAHELSHMVFGNLLTCKWWSDTWMNEGFARFLQYEILHDTNRQWGLNALVPYLSTQVAMQLDAYDTAHALYNPNVETIPQIENMFGTLSYAKGGSILRMMKGVMGSAVYNALRRYVARFRFQNVEHDDLLTVLSEEPISVGFPATNKYIDFNTHMKTWIESNGYPAITLRRVGPGPRDITFEQKRFLLRTGNSSVHTGVDKTRTWHIPLVLSYGSSIIDSVGAPGWDFGYGADKLCWITKATGRLLSECPGEWGTFVAWPPLPSSDNSSTNFIIANPGQTGMYRVNYDRENWRRIALYLNAGPDGHRVMYEVTRGQLIDDAFNLARTGEFDISYQVVFDLIRYLPYEMQYGPFATAMDNMRYLDQMLRSTVNYGNLTEYMRNLFDLKYPEFGPINSTRWSSSVWSDDQDGYEQGSYTTLQFNNVVLENACYYEQAECLNDATSKFAQWKLANQSLSLPYGYSREDAGYVTNFAQTRNMILCYGIRASENATEDWMFLNSMHDRETTPAARASILRALACSKERSLLQRLLQKTLDGTVREQDSSSIFFYMTRWHLGEQLSWDFLRQNWGRLTRRSSIIADVTASFNTRQQLEEVREFRTSLGPDVSEIPAFDKAIDKILANIEWMDESADEVVSQLRTQYKNFLII